MFIPVLRIRDVYPGYESFTSRIPDPGPKIFPDPWSGFASASKNLSILTPKIVSTLSEIWSRVFFPDPDPVSRSWFFTHSGSRTHGSKRHRSPDPRYGSVTLVYPCTSHLCIVAMMWKYWLKPQATATRYPQLNFFKPILILLRIYLCTVRILHNMINDLFFSGWLPFCIAPF